MKKKTIAIALTALVVLAAGGFGAMKLMGGGSENSTESSVKVVAVSELQSGDNSVNNRYSGVVETQKKKNITLDSEKTITKIHIKEGDHVNENDALFTYDTEKTKLEISQKELGKEKINASLEGYKEKINQLNNQLNQGNLSSADRMTVNAEIMEAQTSIAQAEYDLKAADAEINTLNASIKNATVRAPMAGTIEKLEDPESMTDTSAAFITIVADGDFRVKGTVSEQNMGAVYEGLEMLVRSRINSDDTWKGTVTSLESKQNSDDGNEENISSGESASRYSFYVTLDSREGLLLGQHVTLEPYYGEMEGLVLPLGYISYNADGTAYVYAVKEPGQKLEKRSVETGTEYSEQGMVEITSGLSETDYVAWPDNTECVEGAATSASKFAEESQ